jgi:PST family polysaccharide transporter
MGLSLVVGTLVARHLGPINFGEISYILAYIALFQAVATFGTDGIIVSDISRDREKANVTIGTVFILRLLTGVVCWLLAIVYMAVAYGTNDIRVLLIIVGGGGLILQSTDVIDLWFQSQSQSKRTVISKLMAYIIANAVRIGLIMMDAPLWAFVAVITLDAFLGFAALTVAYQKFSIGKNWKFVYGKAKSLLYESWPFMFSALSIAMYTNIDRLMIENILGSRELGIYAAALPLSQAFQFIPVAVSVSVMPFLAKMEVIDHRKYMNNLFMYFRIFLIYGIIMSTIIIFFSDQLIKIFYGKQYEESSIVLAIHVLSNIFICLGLAQGIQMAIEGAKKIIIYKTIIGLVVCVCFNYILIPLYGVVGAAISAVSTQATVGFLVNIILAPSIFQMQINALNPFRRSFHNVNIK